MYKTDLYTLNLPKKYKREILGYQKIPPSEESSWPTLTAVHNLSN